MKDNIYTKSRKKGFILVLTLLVTLILATLVVGFATMSSIDLDLVKNHMYSLKAYYIAEAGVADAINQIQNSSVPFVNTQWQAAFPSGSLDTYTVDANSIAIKSTGFASASNFSRTLTVKIKVSGSSQHYIVSINQWKEATQ
jgi:Tfp pilus assembly protein PilX